MDTGRFKAGENDFVVLFGKRSQKKSPETSRFPVTLEACGIKSSQAR